VLELAPAAANGPWCQHRYSCTTRSHRRSRTVRSAPKTYTLLQLLPRTVRARADYDNMRPRAPGMFGCTHSVVTTLNFTADHIHIAVHAALVERVQ
jgi:hypothetical protein